MKTNVSDVFVILLPLPLAVFALPREFNPPEAGYTPWDGLIAYNKAGYRRFF
jgi:hypothetical protein